MVLKQTFIYRFEVNEGDGYFSIGGEVDHPQDIERLRANYLYSRDKRKRVPPMRCVEIKTVEFVFKEWKK